jgi:diguanylate cyclase (GGDEF)-like protein
MRRSSQLVLSLAAITVLSLVAAWTTLNSPTIFFDHQILLGSSLGVFALLQFGWLGLPVGMVSALCTWQMWGHPWAALAMLLQLLWQQLYLSHFNGGASERGNGRIVLATILFWLLVGMPLQTLLYTGLLRADLASATALNIKEAVVGVVNASLGLLMFLAVQLLQLRRRPGGDLSLRGVVFAVLLLLISLPGVLNSLVTGDQLTARTLTQFRLDLKQQALEVASHLPSGGGALPQVGPQRQLREQVSFEAVAADGQRLRSDPALFNALTQDYRPELETLLAPQGLTLLAPVHAGARLQRILQGYWRYELRLPESAEQRWQQITVVQPAGEQLLELIDSMRPTLQILALLLIAAALISELLTTLVAAQFNRIVGSLVPLNTELDPDPRSPQAVVMPKLQPTRLRELNRIVSLINQQAEIVNQLSAELQLRATTDDLTGLLNRRALLEQLQTLMGQADRRRRQDRLGLLFCDLDLFKEVNDSLGHATGDLVLQTVAARTSRCLRTGDLSGRTGGDEFLVVLHPIPDLDTAMRVAEKINLAIAKPITTPGLRVNITVSIGVAVAKPDEGMDDLIARADQAMYQAKQAGRNQVIRIDCGPQPAGHDR